MKTRILAAVLTIAMLLALLAACAKQDEQTTPSDSESAETNAPSDQSEDESETPEDANPDEEAFAEDPDEIVFYLVTVNTIESDAAQSVEDAINEITIPAINVAIDLNCFDMGSYGTTLSLAISGGDTVDLCSLYGTKAAYSTYLGNGQLMDISGILDEYGQELLDTVGVYIDAYRSAGGIYGVPCYRNYASSIYSVMRQDMLDELGMTEQARNITTFTELEEIFEAVKTNYPDIYAIGGGRMVLWQQADSIGWNSDDITAYTCFDYLGDPLFLVKADDDGTVSNVFESELFQWVCEKTADWYNRGYVWPDCSMEEQQGDTIMKQGVFFSQILSSEYGVETQKKQNTGYDIVACELATGTLKTGVITRFGCGVPVTAEEPEAAVKFLNLLYGSEELMNLLDWGLEGRDYVMLDSGEAAYPEGSNSTVPYHVSDFIFGNFFLVAPWEGNGSDYRAVVKEILDSTEASPFLGFSLNTTELADEIAALTAVKDEFYYGLTCGLYSEQSYQDFLNKLDAAGVETYLAEVQAQLDAWQTAG